MKTWSVWFDGFDPKRPWAVKMPKGIVSFRTKKLALRFANANILLESRF